MQSIKAAERYEPPQCCAKCGRTRSELKDEPRPMLTVQDWTPPHSTKPVAVPLCARCRA